MAAAVVGLIAGMMSLLSPAPAQAAGSIVDGGYIISDAEFFNGNVMSAGEIQTFLNGKVPTCRAQSGKPPCLRNFKANMPAKAADKYCQAVPARANATAAQIIADVGKACGISQKVILVMLQKEQGLVTSTAPSDWNYRAAMGQSCPDTAPCDAAASGFVNQVYLGARQQQVYVKNPNSFNYRPGQVNTIYWHPNKACGTSKVYIQNQATANLYIYTPYRPNIAALAAGHLTGDGCSTYGNRNFYNYYHQWWPGSVPATGGLPAQVAACTVPVNADVAARGDRLVVNTGSLNARMAPTTTCGTGVVGLSRGTVVTATGQYGAWTRATVNGQTRWLTTSYLTSLLPGTPSISGTAVAGQILTAATGTWTPTPTSFGYQWNRNGAAIRGATGREYRVTNADAGANLTVTVTASKVSQTSAAVAARGYSAARIAGVDRYETAVQASRAAYPNGARTVYLVNGATFSDALAAAPLATLDAGSLLLAGTSRVPAATASELKRLSPSRVVLVGGTGVLDRSIAPQLRSLLGSSLAVERVGGSDRYETARLVAERFKSAGTAYIATGVDFADALGAAAAAGKNKAPVLLVNGASAAPEAAVTSTLKKLGVKNLVVVGETGAVSSGIQTTLTRAGFSVKRYGGADRYATNAALNMASFTSAGSIVIATGQDFPDALTGAVLAGRRGVPIFVTPGTCVQGGAADFLRSAGGTSYTLVGGTGVLNDGVGTFRRC